MAYQSDGPAERLEQGEGQPISELVSGGMGCGTATVPLPPLRVPQPPQSHLVACCPFQIEPYTAKLQKLYRRSAGGPAAVRGAAACSGEGMPRGAAALYMCG